MLLKWIQWTFVNERRQLLLEFDSQLKHPETLLVSLQNFVHASLFCSLEYLSFLTMYGMSSGSE